MVLKVVSFPLSISHFWKEAGPGEDLFRNFLKKWPADGAAALAAPKASRAALAKRHLNKQEGNWAFLSTEKNKTLKNRWKGFEIMLKRKSFAGKVLMLRCFFTALPTAHVVWGTRATPTCGSGRHFSISSPSSSSPSSHTQRGGRKPPRRRPSTSSISRRQWNRNS